MSLLQFRTPLRDAQFRRPVILVDEIADQIEGAPDPAERSEVAHATANALLKEGRADAQDRQLLSRLVELVDREGIDALAEIWSNSAANTLPGTLWRLYLLREWVNRDAAVIADRYRAGVIIAEVSDAITGAQYAPGPAELKEVTTAILTGAFAGDFDVALHRAAGFSRVIAAGTSEHAVAVEKDHPDAARALARNARLLANMADDFDHSAALWRGGRLD